MNETNREKNVADSDEDLMVRHRQGEAGVLETLIRRHADGLLGFLVRMMSDRGAAEDLFQETFLRVHTKADTFNPEQRFKTWLYAIAAHAAIDAKRKTARGPGLVSLDADDDASPALLEKLSAPVPHPSEKLSAKERKVRVRAAVDLLPPRQKATLQLAYFQEMTYPEVAETMGCTVGTVKTQMSRAMQTLARLLPNTEGGAR